MSQWKPYTGTDEQIAEMKNAEHGFILRDVNNEECNNIKYISDFMGRHHLKRYLGECEIKHYLICNPHPLADMIERQARTGQPVWVKTFMEMPYAGLPILDERIQKTNKPDWNIPGAEYSFEPFEEEK